MSNFIESLELSTRASNALKDNFVTDHEAFMSLTEDVVVRWSKCGRKTWLEIQQLQAHFNYIGSKREHWHKFKDVVGYLNQLMVDNPQFRTVDNGQGFLTAVRCDTDDADRRFK